MVNPFFPFAVSTSAVYHPTALICMEIEIGQTPFWLRAPIWQTPKRVFQVPHTHTHQVLTKHCVWANIFPTKKSYGTLKPNIFFTQPCARLLSERVEGKMPETEIYLFFFSFFVFLDLSLGFLFDSSFLVLLLSFLGSECVSSGSVFLS